MKKAAGIAAAAIAALAAIIIVILLIGSLRTAFMPTPTQYENSVWRSEDGKLTLNVYEYDENELQCRAELIYEDKIYSVYDSTRGELTVRSDNGTDGCLRSKCDEKGFTVILNRSGELEYSKEYGRSQEVKFIRE